MVAFVVVLVVLVAVVAVVLVSVVVFLVVRRHRKCLPRDVERERAAASMTDNPSGNPIQTSPTTHPACDYKPETHQTDIQRQTGGTSDARSTHKDTTSDGGITTTSSTPQPSEKTAPSNVEDPESRNLFDWL